MKRAFIAFLLVGFFFGVAATQHVSHLKSKSKASDQKFNSESSSDNFDFLYGQWELLNAQGLKSRSPASLEDVSTNVVFEDDIYVDSSVAKANAPCNSGVQFERFSRSRHKDFLKQVRRLPLLTKYFGDGKRDGIWTGEVVCKETKKPLWEAVLLTRRQLFLVSGTHVAELYRRDSVQPIRDSFTDTDSEVGTDD